MLDGKNAGEARVRPLTRQGRIAFVFTMIIIVRRIDITQTPEYEHGLYSYWIEFESTLTAGQALLYSHATPDKLLAGQEISVETSQGRITDFHVLPIDDQPNLGRLTPLMALCDYEVVGRVVFLAQEVFDVVIDSRCSVTIEFDEIGPIKIKKDDWVAFKLMGLALWDEHV